MSQSPSASPLSSSDSWIDMATIMRIENLQWRAKTIVTGFSNGVHRSPKHGFSVEFSEYRPFSLGDDPRTIDWKLYARSDRFYIKKFEDETNRRCFLVVDQSRSMEYGSLSYSKLEYARTTAATLAYYWTLQRDAVGIVTFDEMVRDFLPSRFRTGQLKRILSLLGGEPSGKSTDVAQPLRHVAEMVHQRSLIVVISDFFVKPPTLEPVLAYLQARGHEVVLMQIVDPAEREWNRERASMVRDMETGDEIFVDPRTAVQNYRKKFDAHQNDWRELSRQHRATWVSLSTNDSIELALFELLQRQILAGGKR